MTTIICLSKLFLLFPLQTNQSWCSYPSEQTPSPHPNLRNENSFYVFLIRRDGFKSAERQIFRYMNGCKKDLRSVLLYKFISLSLLQNFKQSWSYQYVSCTFKSTFKHQFFQWFFNHSVFAFRSSSIVLSLIKFRSTFMFIDWLNYFVCWN